MGNTNSMADHSAWFRQYEKEVNGKKNDSDGKKKILLIIPILLIGGMIAMMVKNGAPKGGITFLAGIGIFLLALILFLTSKKKKADPAEITRKDLDALLHSPEDAGEFDAQMNAAPIFQVANKKDEYIFATKDYIGTKFNYLGDTTYRLIRIRDIFVLHTIQNNTGHVDVEFRDDNRKVLLTWVAADMGRVDELKENLQSIHLKLDVM